MKSRSAPLRLLRTESVVWTVPASRMKNGREHRVPLTAEAVALLESLPRMDGSPYVFFAPRGGMLSDMSISAVMRRMQEAEVKAGRAGYLDPRIKAPRRAARAALDLPAMGGGTGLSARHGGNRAGAFHRFRSGARLSALGHARPAAGDDGRLGACSWGNGRARWEDSPHWCGLRA